MERFFCTHGRGLSKFALDELKCLEKEDDKFELEEFVEGKIAFKTNAAFSKLLELKQVERLFLTIFFFKFGAKKEKDNLLDENFVESFIDQNFNLDLDSSSFRQILVNLDKNINKTNEDKESQKKICRQLSFRINFKTTGKWKIVYKNEILKSKIIQLITNKLQLLSPYLEVDLREPLLEFSCHLSETCLAFGLNVSKNSLSLRNYIKNVGLRSTICSSMLQLANFNNESFLIVIDPFCGKSTIMTEYFASNIDKKNLFFLGSDSNLEQIKFSEENLNYKEDNNLHDLILAKIRMNSIFPYRDRIANLIISDLPFGLKHPRKSMQTEVKNESELFYEKVLSEFDRILVKECGCAVILINANETEIFEKATNKLYEDKSILLKIIEKHIVSLGETNACIYKLIN